MKRRLLAALAATLLLVAPTQANMTSVDGNRNPVTLKTFVMPDGSHAFGHVIYDPNTGAPYGPTDAPPLPVGAAQDGTDATGVSPPVGGVGIRGWLSALFSVVGAPGATVCSTDTGSCTVNALLQRAAQDITVLTAAITADLGVPGSSACSTDTGSCSTNSQLQLISQHLTAIVTALGSPAQAGGSIAATQSGTWTVQIGNTPNTTPILATDSATGSTGSAVPAKAGLQGVSVGGNLTGLVGDPCQVNAHIFTPINISTAVNTKIVAGTSAKKTYICHLFLFSAGTQNVGIVEGSGTNCGSSTLGLIGGATAATGPNLTAQTGFVEGTGGNAVAASTVNANDFCLITSAAIQLSGIAVTVQQ